MISVLTLTYQRHHLLEEAIESFLRQDFSGESEMVIINDSDKVEYVLDNPRIKIINLKERFPSIGQKLRFGFTQCKYDNIFRLDDDDLLTPWALRNAWDDITNHPGHEIYRSNGHYYFTDNKFQNISDNVNNGNIYTKNYLSRITFPDISFGEDFVITFQNDADMYVSPREEKSMIYRVGMNTFHISGMGNISNNNMIEWTDRIVENSPKTTGKGFETGRLVLRPHFTEDYYQQI